jgi:signal transduction histidine kinase
LGTVLEIAWGAHPSEEIETLLSQGSRVRAVFNILEQAKEAARRVVIDTFEDRGDRSIEYVSLPFESKAFAAVLQFDSGGAPGGEAPCSLLHLWTVEDLIVLVQDLAKESGPWNEAGVSVLSENGEVLFSTSAVDLTPEGVIASRLNAIAHLEIVAFPLSGSPDAIVSNEIRTYSVLIIFVVLAVVSGLYLTVRSISRELSLARLRSDFVAGVSHEFKTPLSLIRLHVENLRSGWVKDEKRQEYYEVITREAERLSGLVDNALSLARIEAGTEHYHRKPIDFSRLVGKTVDGFRTHLEDKGISVSLRLPVDSVPVEGDSEALERMLINLLSNAAKYMRDDERRIDVRLETEGDNARLDIADTGIGISEKDLEKLFEKFFRAQDQPGKPVGGSGVGLTLVKHIVDSHDGQITVDSEPGKGSKFSVRLPLMGARAGI